MFDLRTTFTFIFTWLKNRLAERTTWDGIILIGAAIAYLILEPFATIIAYGAIAYGAWTIYKSEFKK